MERTGRKGGEKKGTVPLSPGLSQLLDQGSGLTAEFEGHVYIEPRGLDNVIRIYVHAMASIHLFSIRLRPGIGAAFDRRNAMATEQVCVVGGVAFTTRIRPSREPEALLHHGDSCATQNRVGWSNRTWKI